jgi:hypothetical protein
MYLKKQVEKITAGVKGARKIRYIDGYKRPYLYHTSVTQTKPTKENRANAHNVTDRAHDAHVRQQSPKISQIRTRLWWQVTIRHICHGKIRHSQPTGPVSHHKVDLHPKQSRHDTKTHRGKADQIADEGQHPSLRWTHPA